MKQTGVAMNQSTPPLKRVTPAGTSDVAPMRQPTRPLLPPAPMKPGDPPLKKVPAGVKPVASVLRQLTAPVKLGVKQPFGQTLQSTPVTKQPTPVTKQPTATTKPPVSTSSVTVATQQQQQRKQQQQQQQQQQPSPQLKLRNYPQQGIGSLGVQVDDGATEGRGQKPVVQVLKKECKGALVGNECKWFCCF